MRKKLYSVKPEKRKSTPDPLYEIRAKQKAARKQKIEEDLKRHPQPDTET